MKTYVIVCEGDNVQHHMASLERAIDRIQKPEGAMRSERVVRAFVRDTRDEDLVKVWEYAQRR